MTRTAPIWGQARGHPLESSGSRDDGSPDATPSSALPGRSIAKGESSDVHQVTAITRSARGARNLACGGSSRLGSVGKIPRRRARDAGNRIRVICGGARLRGGGSRRPRGPCTAGIVACELHRPALAGAVADAESPRARRKQSLSGYAVERSSSVRGAATVPCVPLSSGSSNPSRAESLTSRAFIAGPRRQPRTRKFGRAMIWR